jgi:hypothetical protein
LKPRKPKKLPQREELGFKRRYKLKELPGKRPIEGLMQEPSSRRKRPTD